MQPTSRHDRRIRAPGPRGPGARLFWDFALGPCLTKDDKSRHNEVTKRKIREIVLGSMKAPSSDCDFNSDETRHSSGLPLTPSQKPPLVRVQQWRVEQTSAVKPPSGVIVRE